MSSPAVVPKPANAGAGQVAIANTRSAYANLRNGPGTQYADIGDVRDKTLVVYYPNSRTTDQWYYVEQNGVGGWVAGSVVEFEPAVGAVRPSDKPTPYDGKAAIWHWKGDGVPENTIEELIANLKRRAPNLSQIWVKTSDGIHWQGRFDNSGMAVNTPADIDRWVRLCEQNNLEFHAWCVPQGLNIEAETNAIIEVCKRPGVKSMILDVEPYAGFWQGGREAVRPFMLRLRQAISSRFHIGFSMDPRPWHYESIFPAEWLPFIDSLHPQCYWRTFRASPADTLEQMMTSWAGYGRPIIPALQADGTVLDQNTAHTLSTQKYGFAGVSWWRYGVVAQYDVVNKPVTLTSPSQPPSEPTDNFADEVIVVPGGAGFRSGSYTGRNEFSTFQGTWNWPVYYKKTETTTSTVWAEWKTTLPESGRYEIATFVPARHSTTQRARFKVHGIRGTNTEVVIDIDQSRNRNLWVSLGVFDLVKEQPNAGKVFLNDVTGEVDREIAFDAVRFRRIVTLPPAVPPGGNNTNTPPPSPTRPPGGWPTIVNGIFVADGYDSPVGTADQRGGAQVWPQGWVDASPFAKLYFVGTPSQAYHTGADLNWGRPYDDKGMPVYSPASGIVIYQADLRPWGNVTIIKHDPLRAPNGMVTYSRYGHMQNVRVRVGQRVKRGDQIGEIGDGGGRFVPHLHYDISPTTILETSPGDWPGMNLARLLKNYVDPRIFTVNNRP